jgi:hypothetical protein
MVFNNFQARFRLAEIPGYILPGQLGLSGFCDVGRVWIKEKIPIPGTRALEEDYILFLLV